MILYFKCQIFLYGEGKWVKTRITKGWRDILPKQKPSRVSILNKQQQKLEVDVRVGMPRAVLPFLRFTLLPAQTHTQHQEEMPLYLLFPSLPHHPIWDWNSPKRQWKQVFDLMATVAIYPTWFFQCFRCTLVNGPPKQRPKHGWTTTTGLNQTSRQIHEDVRNHPWACPGVHSQLPPPPRLGIKLQYFQWSMLMRSPEPAGVFVRCWVPGSLPSVLLGTQAPEFLPLLAAAHKAPFKSCFFFFPSVWEASVHCQETTRFQPRAYTVQIQTVISARVGRMRFLGFLQRHFELRIVLK